MYFCFIAPKTCQEIRDLKGGNAKKPQNKQVYHQYQILVTTVCGNQYLTLRETVLGAVMSDEDKVWQTTGSDFFIIVSRASAKH